MTIETSNSTVTKPKIIFEKIDKEIKKPDGTRIIISHIYKTIPEQTD